MSQFYPVPSIARTDGITLDTNSDGALEIKGDGPLPLEVAQNQLEIVELQAETSIGPLDHDTLFSDTFNDSTGYNNTVNTGNTTATFSTNKYVRAGVGPTSQANGATFNSTGSVTSYQGIRVKALSNLTIASVTKNANCTATKAYIVNAATDELLATAAFSGNTATFASQVQFLADAEYFIVCGSDGASYTRSIYGSGNDLPINNATDVNWVIGCEGAALDSLADGSAYSRNIASIATYTTGTSKLVEVDIPTIAGTVNATMMVVNAPDRESGDNITYDLVDSEGNIDAGLALNTKHTLVNVDGTKLSGGKVKINLISKTNGSANVPSIQTYAVKLWKNA